MLHRSQPYNELDDNDYVIHTGHVHSSIIKSTVCYKSIRKARALNDYVNAPLLNVTDTTLHDLADMTQLILKYASEQRCTIRST